MYRQWLTQAREALRQRPELERQMRRELDRAVSFASFLWMRFVSDRCFQYAGVLSYLSLIALVPLMAVGLSLISGFAVFDTWVQTLQSYIFENFVPGVSEEIQRKVIEFANNARQLTAPGVAALLITAIFLMIEIEGVFNQIFRVTEGRRSVGRFAMYWAVLSLGPVIMILSLAISSYVFTRTWGELDQEAASRVHHLLQAAPFFLAWIGFSFAYIMVPNRPIRWRYGFIGGFFAAASFEIAKRVFVIYLQNFKTYEQVYGALWTLPTLLLWIYTSWVVVLLGASLASSLSTFRYRPRESAWPAGQELYALLVVVRYLHGAQRQGLGLSFESLNQLEPGIADDTLARMLGSLEHGRIIARTEAGHYVLVRDLDELSLGDLYRTGHYHWPTIADVPNRADLAPIVAELAAARGAFSEALNIPLKSIYQART